METLVNVGSEIFLNAQLSDGTLSFPKKIKATLLDPNGVIISVVDLTHIGSGLFTSRTEIMPQLPYITAQYMVYEEDGITPDTSYSMGMDVFRNSKLVSLGGDSVGGINEIVVEVSDACI